MDFDARLIGEGYWAALAAREGDTAVFDVPRSTPPRPDEPATSRPSMRDTAQVASVPAVWGMFLHLCAEARGARTILELGSGVGISGCLRRNLLVWRPRSSGASAPRGARKRDAPP